MRRPMAALGVSILVALGSASAGNQVEVIPSKPRGADHALHGDSRRRWVPQPRGTWQLQLTGVVDTGVEADVYDIDMFDNPKATVSELHDRRRKVICYINAGAWERWRPDASRFPERVKGARNGWPGERWLDVRKLHVLRPLMERRLDQCAAKGFDGVDFDNVDGYANRSGFRIRGHDQLRYNLWLAKAAHARGLSAGLKNDLGQAEALERRFDFAVNEQCFQFDECGRLRPFSRSNKAVFHVEYALSRAEFCRPSARLGLSSMRKRRSLGRWRRPCR